MSARAKKRPKAEAPSTARQRPRTEHVEKQRRQIFKAMAVISCCRLATASLLVDGDDDADGSRWLNDSLADALAAAHDLLDDVAAELEELT